MIESSTYEKRDRLKGIIKEYGSVAVAFSGGVDSTFLLAVAHEVLGDSCIAISAYSSSFPKRERSDSESFCRERGIKQLSFETNELSLEEYAKNPRERCYFCKRALFTEMKKIAFENGARKLLEGSNSDDLSDYRPGMRAILELSVASPLQEAGLLKSEIRALSEEMGLPTWDKASFACLATRIPYGERITKEKLNMIETVENALSAAGFKQYRARYLPLSDKKAALRIELLPQEQERILKPEVRDKVISAAKTAGFSYTLLDLLGYRMGSMNGDL